jgi:hypothetical protein
MDATITIPSRFCGPPTSANGGYSCGVTALALTDGPATVTLRPPPLDRPLRVERSRERVALHDGTHLVAEGRGADEAIALPPPVAYDSARRAAEEFDVHHYAEAHAFPSCFTCGPARPEGDGLRLFPARTGHRDRLVVWPWVPDPSVGDEDGLVLGPVIWAVLDCPGGWAWTDPTQPLPPPAVLGRMTAAVHRRPSIGEQLVVAGWPITADSRKRLSGSAVWSADGTVLAASAATWVVLDGTQRDAFGAAG